MRGNYTIPFSGGSHNGQTVSDGTYTKRFYIPLRFWFNNNEGMYLPLVSFLNIKLNYFLILLIVIVLLENQLG